MKMSSLRTLSENMKRPCVRTSPEFMDTTLLGFSDNNCKKIIEMYLVVIFPIIYRYGQVNLYMLHFAGNLTLSVQYKITISGATYHLVPSYFIYNCHSMFQI